jgi:hypothetical protein
VSACRDIVGDLPQSPDDRIVSARDWRRGGQDRLDRLRPASLRQQEQRRRLERLVADRSLACTLAFDFLDAVPELPLAVDRQFIELAADQRHRPVVIGAYMTDMPLELETLPIGEA